MTNDLRDLYQEVILDHAKNPRNCGTPDSDDYRIAYGNNPLCGDKLTLYIKLINGVICDIIFEGNGCAISTASTSLMTETVKGKSEIEVREIFQQFHDLMTNDNKVDTDMLNKLTVFSGVREFPVRVKCATLAWHTMIAILNGNDSSTTEI